MTQRTCSIENCASKVIARGWCSKHYQRFQRNGTTELPERKKIICSIDDCGRPAIARNWCTKHYQRWQHTGDPAQANGYYTSTEESFTARTEWHGECLYWMGSLTPDGYGNIWVDGRVYRAHRYAWERAYGPIPEGMEIDHAFHCEKRCCNVDHLRIATQGQNNSNLPGPNSDNKTSRVRNVHKNGNGWRVVIRKDRQRLGFGTYSTIEEAAEVAEQARKDLFGEFAGRG